MKKLEYLITTLEPLIITQQSDDPYMYETLQYIRGTVIQGIFAQYFLKATNGVANDVFTRLIVSGDVIFGNAFPVESNKVFEPPPLMLAKEKYRPKRVHNLLVSNTDEQTMGISSLIHITGNNINPLIIRKEIRLHNEIDDHKRTTKEGILFNYQSLPAGIVFHGALTLKNDDDEKLIHTIVENNKELRIGRSATSEYGNIRFNWIENDENKKNDPQNADIEKVDENKQIDAEEVIMTLLSDTIIYNKNGFSSTSVDDIQQYFEESTIVNSISRKSRIEGFLNVWKLRKPSENVFAAGSSFLLNKLPKNATLITAYGLGERTHEGYGQVSFSMLNPKLTELNFKEWEEPKLDQPTGNPKLTEEILVSVILKRTKEGIIKNALEDATNTNKIPTNHLLGKLKDMAENVETFSENMDDLKDIAINQLRKAYIHNHSMFDHLKERAENIGRICNLTNQFGQFKIDLTAAKAELTKLYLQQYLKQLRRKN